MTTSSGCSTPAPGASSCRWSTRSKRRKRPSPRPGILPSVTGRSADRCTPSISAPLLADYYKRANDEILVVLQTESPRGVHNAEAIYSLKGVDAIFVGPNDLTAQMRDADGKDPLAEEHSKPCCSGCWPPAKKSARRSGCTCNRSKPSRNANRRGLAVPGARQRAADDGGRSPAARDGPRSEDAVPAIWPVTDRYRRSGRSNH